MMKTTLTLIALVAPMVVSAQTGVIATHPANNDGKELTMEEAVMSGLTASGLPGRGKTQSYSTKMANGRQRI